MKNWMSARLVVIVCTAILAPYPRLEAATIHVDSGEVLIVSNGSCSPREAIINANDDASTHSDFAGGSGSDTIQLPESTYSIADADNH